MSQTITPIPSKLSTKHVLIFGGSSGIGLATAQLSLQAGAHVTICSSNTSKLTAVSESLRSAYPGCSLATHTIDLSDPATLEENFTALFSSIPAVDHIAFIAGDMYPSPEFSALRAEDYFASGVVRIAAPLVLGSMLARPENAGWVTRSAATSITLTGGINSRRPGKGWVLAGTHGAAAEALARPLSVELAPIRVNTVVPGAIDTPLLRLGGEDAMDGYKRMSLQGALGKPQDVAEAYLYFMRDGNVTGQSVASDGGFLLSR